MNEINSLNIPAYQRKKALEKKAKQTIKKSKTKTARTITPRPRYSEPIREVRSHANNNEPGFREMKICGQCEGYFEKINVTIIKVTSPIHKGDILIFEKEGGLFEQPVESMQIDRKDVTLARSGSDIGIKTELPPIVGSNIYKVI